MMTILHISDTHGLHKQLLDLPPADIIIHSGDITENGTEEEVFDFVNWFCDLPYKYKIFIAGNHDTCLSGVKLEGLDDNCYYLDGSSVIIDGLKFHGIPLFACDQQNGRLDQLIKRIPKDIDVLITHIPPLGILDYADQTNYGNFALLEADSEICPKLHLFGHVHSQNGICKMERTTYSNASLISSDFQQLLQQNVRIYNI